MSEVDYNLKMEYNSHTLQMDKLRPRKAPRSVQISTPAFVQLFPFLPAQLPPAMTRLT